MIVRPPIDAEFIKKMLPPRNANTHKGDYGKILLLCGSRGYTGAAALSAMGALRTGAGLVYLAVPESIYAIEATKLLEPVVIPLPDKDGMFAQAACDKVNSMISNMDGILIGPGIGQSNGPLSLLESVLNNAKCPVVVDADGINILSRHKDILRERTSPTILTPHDGEFVRIFGHIAEDRCQCAADLATELGCIVLLKGHRTIITDGDICYINQTGNPGMAKGGSGDVLAGMIVSLIGQGIAPLEAAASAAWLHGRAGDLCADSLGQYGMLPQDMVNVLPKLLG